MNGKRVFLAVAKRQAGLGWGATVPLKALAGACRSLKNSDNLATPRQTRNAADLDVGLSEAG